MNIGCVRQVECKKAQPKEVMLPVNAARGRATALRAGYGELLLLSAAAANAAAATSVPAVAAATAGPAPSHAIGLSGAQSAPAQSAAPAPAPAPTHGASAGASPGKSGLSAAAAALLGNGLVSYRYAPYPMPVSAGHGHGSSGSSAASEALVSMAGLALPGIHPQSFASLYPLYAAHASQSAPVDLQAVAAAHQHQAAVHAAVHAKQRAAAGFLNLHVASANQAAAAAAAAGQAMNGQTGAQAGPNHELNLPSFAGIEGFYPVPVGL